MLVLLRSKTPLPDFVIPKALPLNAISPPYVKEVPVATSNVLFADNVVLRLALRVIVAVVANVPPAKVKWLCVGAPGAVPRLLSDEMLKTPPLIVVLPV